MIREIQHLLRVAGFNRRGAILSIYDPKVSKDQIGKDLCISGVNLIDEKEKDFWFMLNL